MTHKEKSQKCKRSDSSIPGRVSRCVDASASRILHYVVSLLLFFSIGSSNYTLAQTFPVQATTQLTPPYSTYLSDYVAPGSERLALEIFLGDIARPELDVRFRLKIIGQNITLETKPEYIPAPIAIQGGVPMRLISSDLAGYFEPRNLIFTGITQYEYEKKGRLPEGVYQFCFEVLEYNRGIKISNTACASAWMILNDPPIINSPAQNAKLQPQSPQNVVFQWTPRHTASPNATLTEYEFKLVEVWPSNRDPNDAMLSTPPIFEATTSNSMLIYGPAETPLEFGRRYAFRVQAKSVVGIETLDLFKNQGYSETFTFVYGDACDLPTGISAEVLGSSRFSLKWESRFNHTAYKVRYRQVGTTNWYENNLSFNETEINSLKPATTYEYQVSGACGFYESPYSNVARVTTKVAPEEAYSCGLPMTPFDLDPSKLTGSLKVGDIVNAGDFDVQVTKVTGSGGTFSGEGVVVMPMMNKVKVKTEFSNITVANVGTSGDYRMVRGIMNVTSGGVEVVPQEVTDFMDELVETLDVVDSVLGEVEKYIPRSGPDPVSFAADTLIQIDGNIIAVVRDPNTGNVIVTSTNGKTTQLPPGENYAITDKSGKGYLVDARGGVTKTTAEIAVKASKRIYNLQLDFAKVSNTKHGFDTKKIDALAYTYEKLGDSYYVPWKAVDATKPDFSKAFLKDNNLDVSKVRFEKEIVNATVNAPANKEWSVNLNSISPGETGTITAFFPPRDTTEKEQILGKLNVKGYSHKEINLVVVPVNNAINPFSGQSELRDSLNRIYSQAVVGWQVRFESKLTVDLGTDFDAGGSDLLSNYTGDMKKVINAYGGLDDNSYYLFLIQKTSKIAIDGYMPRSKQAGFIFVGQSPSKPDVIRTIGHELGHGVFALKHTFSEFTTIPKGSTKNLMDYADAYARELLKFQWDRIHDPVTVIGLFEEDEEGMSVAAYSLTFTAGIDSKRVCRISPDGRLFDLKSLSEYAVCAISPGTDYVVQSMWKPVLSTGDEVMGYEDIIYKFKSVGNDFGQYYPYDNKTNKFVKDGKALDLTYVDGACETVLAKLVVGELCGYIDIRKPDLGGVKSYLLIKGSPTPLTQEETVNFIQTQITHDAVQFPTALYLTLEQKSARKCVYTLGELECAGKNIELLRKQKSEVESIISTGTIEELVNKLNEVSICALIELSYEQIEKIIDRLASPTSLDGKTELAILKSMQSIPSNKYETFIKHLRGDDNSYKIAKHLIKEINGDEYIKFIETISIIIAQISNADDLKWSFVNTWITERYGDIKAHEKAGIGSIFISMEEHKNLSGRIPQITNIFFNMLLTDLRNLKNFKLIYQVAAFRQVYPEVFGNFTQALIEFQTSQNVFCKTTISAASSSSELNWLKPVACIVKTENCFGSPAEGIKEVSVTELAKFLEWPRFLENNRNIAKLYDSDETKLQLIQKFIEQFNLFIERKNQENASFWSNYSLTDDCKSLNPAIEHVQAFENASTLKKVDKQLRLRLVKSMFLCGISVNEQFWKLQFSENVLLKLLASFEKNDPSIITALEEVGINNVCKQLVGDQFTKVSLWMAAQLQGSQRTKPLNVNQIFDGEGKVRSLFNGSTFIAANDILQLESDMFQWENFSGRFTSKTAINTEIGSFEYNQEVLVYVAGDFEFLGQQIRAGSIIQMPLIQAYAMSEGNRAVVLEKSLWFAFDVGTLLIGLGEIKIFFTAGQLLTKAIVLTDIVASTAGTIVNALNENYISPQLRSRIQLLSLIGSGPQILRSIGKVDKLIVQADEALNELRGLNSINQSSLNFRTVDQYVSSIKAKIREVANTTTQFDNLLLAMKGEAGFLKNYNSLSDELKAVFKSDFSGASNDILGELKKGESQFFEGWKKFRIQNPSAVLCTN